MVTWAIALRRRLQPSKFPKKKVLSRMIGPPTLAPNWFWRSGVLEELKLYEWRASKTSLRTNQKSEP